MSNTQEGTAVAVEVKEIKVSEVKALLEQGLDRKEIAAFYGKAVAEMARVVWSDSALKNLKKKSAPSIVLINDEVAEASVVAETSVETAGDVADNATEEVEQANIPASPASDSQWQ